MIRRIPHLTERRPPGILMLLFTRGFDAALTAVCTFTAFSVLSAN
jgi:hypothetical protein